MASRYLIPAGGTYVNAATDIWAGSSGSAADGAGLLAVEDIAFLDNLSGNLTLAGALTSIGLNMELYPSNKSLDLDGNNMVINGLLDSFGGSGLVENGGTVTVSGTGAHTIHDNATIENTVTLKFTAASGTPTLDPASITFPTIGGLTIDNNPTSFIINGHLPLSGDLTFTAGKFDTATNTVKVTHSGTSELKWNNVGQALHDYEIADSALILLTANAQLLKFTNGTGRLTGAFDLFLHMIGNGKWVQGSGQIDINRIHFRDRTGGGGFRGVGTLDGSSLATGVTITGGKETHVKQTGDWNIGTKALAIDDDGDELHGHLDSDTFNLTVGAMTLGAGPADRGGGKWFCGSGSHAIASLVHAAGNDEVSEVQFETSHITLSGTMNFADIMHNNVSALVNGGKIDNATFSDSTILLHFDRTAPLGTNTGVHAAVYEVMGGTGVYAGGVAA